MKQVWAICKLNITVLFKDKISLLWSLVLPTIMLILNVNNILQPEDLVYWWIYICVNSFLYGVGLHALQSKDSGFLTFLYSIKWMNLQFFAGCLLTQIIFSFTTMTIFNIIVTFVLGFNFFYLLFLSMVSLLIALPFAIISYNLTYLSGLYSSSISSIANIITFSLFILIGFDTVINNFNPFIILGYVQTSLLAGSIPIFEILVILLLVLISIPSIYFFKPVSLETR